MSQMATSPSTSSLLKRCLNPCSSERRVEPTRSCRPAPRGYRSRGRRSSASPLSVRSGKSRAARRRRRARTTTSSMAACTVAVVPFVPSTCAACSTRCMSTFNIVRLLTGPRYTQPSGAPHSLNRPPVLLAPAAASADPYTPPGCGILWGCAGRRTPRVRSGRSSSSRGKHPAVFNYFIDWRGDFNWLALRLQDAARAGSHPMLSVGTERRGSRRADLARGEGAAFWSAEPSRRRAGRSTTCACCRR